MKDQEYLHTIRNNQGELIELLCTSNDEIISTQPLEDSYEQSHYNPFSNYSERGDKIL